MGKIIDRLRGIGVQIEDEEKELALIVALLHDIGYGPFSHCIEDVIGKSHEQWTVEIIKGKTEVNKILEEDFGNDVPNKVSDIILGKEIPKKDVNLFFVLKFLISSQLDADRLDYLVRDSTEIGINFGKLDLDRIINGIRITQYRDRIYTCILEKNIIDIENYLISRYNMYEIVYLNPIKCEYENIIALIFTRIKEIKEKIEVPKNIAKIIKKEIILDEYIELDDYDIISEFKALIKEQDPILKKLCEAIIYRKKFERINILENDKISINEFEEELRNIMFEYKIDQNLIKYMFIKYKGINKMYKRKSNESIFVLKNNGVVVDIEELISGIDRKHEKKYNFLNTEMILEYVESSKKEEFKQQVALLVSKFNKRNFIEIERKFYLNEEIENNEIIKCIKSFSQEVKIGEVMNKEYLDEYYDFEDYMFKNKMSLRLRTDENKMEVTFKKPTGDEAGRFEYEREIYNKEYI